MGGSSIHLYPHVAVSLPPVPSRGGLAETVFSTGFSWYDPQAEGGDAGPISICSPKYKRDCPSAGLHHQLMVEHVVKDAEMTETHREVLIRKLAGQQQGSGKRVAAGDVDVRGHAAASVHPAIGVCLCGVMTVAYWPRCSCCCCSPCFRAGAAQRCGPGGRRPRGVAGRHRRRQRPDVVPADELQRRLVSGHPHPGPLGCPAVPLMAHLADESGDRAGRRHRLPPPRWQW